MATTVGTSPADIQLRNQTFCDMIENDGMRKRAADDASDYIRLKLREEGFSRKILEPVEVGNDFDRAVWTDKPIKIYDRESDVPMSYSVGYSNTPIGVYIRPKRFIVTPTMIISPRVSKHKWELRTYKYDVKQVWADNMVKDMQAVEDRQLLNTVNVALVGQGSTVPGTSTAQWVGISGGFTRSSTVEACYGVLQATEFNIPVETCLINNLTFKEYFKWRRDEVGGDLAEKNLVQGWSQVKLHNVNWLVTLKRALVANNTQYLFGPTKFLGKSCLFTPPTMYFEVQHVGMYSFYAVEEIGTTLAHVGALGRVDYQT
jgi:hypothetical protein